MVPGVQNIMFKVHLVFHSDPRHMSDLTSTTWTSKLSDCQRTPPHSCSHITMASKQHWEPLHLPHFPQYLRWKWHKLDSVNNCWMLQSTADCTVTVKHLYELKSTNWMATESFRLFEREDSKIETRLISTTFLPLTSLSQLRMTSLSSWKHSSEQGMKIPAALSWDLSRLSELWREASVWQKT